MYEQTDVENPQAADANEGESLKQKNPKWLDNCPTAQAKTLTYDLTNEPLCPMPRASTPSADREVFVEAVSLGLESNTNDHHK